MDDVTDTQMIDLMPGQLLARGVCRHMASMGFVCLEEFVPAKGLRVDVLALGPKGELWVIECKSSKADFQTDKKWEGYLAWCDRYFWAVDMDFPTDLLPEGTGLLVGDSYDAEIIRMAPEEKLAPARRKVIIQKFAMNAARRLQSLRDPMGARLGVRRDDNDGEILLSGRRLVLSRYPNGACNLSQFRRQTHRAC